ncbi:hypothetical protein HK404_37210 [Myxococcus xanthus]|nr:hypothetical protein [Myxococcus xanthus]
MMGGQRVGVSEDEEKTPGGQLSLGRDPIEFGDIEDGVEGAHMGQERPSTRTEDLGEETVDGWERTTEDVLQFIHDKVWVAFDLTAGAGSVAPEQCK